MPNSNIVEHYGSLSRDQLTSYVYRYLIQIYGNKNIYPFSWIQDGGIGLFSVKRNDILLNELDFPIESGCHLDIVEIRRIKEKDGTKIFNEIIKELQEK